VRRIAQNAFLHAYRLVIARGLLRRAWGRRLFYTAYELYKRLFEARDIAALRAYVPECGLVIDVDANVGFFTERFARWVGPAGRVVAIEPEANNFAELVWRLAAKGLAGRVEALLEALARHGYAPHVLARGGGGARACARADLDAILARRGYTDLLFLAGPN
jgi:hypothetical protein